MTLVAVSMRVCPLPERGEVHDSLDQRWYELLGSCGLELCVVPNDVGTASLLLERLNPDGLVLTGGGDIPAVSRQRTARDDVEALLLRWASHRGRPVLGVCRGMQAIIDHAGGSLLRAEGHVGVRHGLMSSARMVNSYHGLVVRDLPAGFQALERSHDGGVEACISVARRQLGLMWHPERERPFQTEDIDLITQHLTGQRS